MLTRAQKLKFVEEYRKMLKSYKVVGILQLKGIPDRLLQSTKNQLRSSTKFVMGRKTLLGKILEGSESTKKLMEHLTETSVIILSNEDPFELSRKFKSNSLRLAAKPGQVASEDVNVFSGETGIQPGQTVTDLKSAGIDVQIQKGKVVIAKDKVLVKKGELIGANIAKALHTLDILPFKAVLEPSALLFEGIMYNKRVLAINQESTTNELVVCFRGALGICLEANIINAYTINNFITKGYRNALHLGLEVHALDSGIVEMLLANAANGAAALNSELGTRPEN